MRPASTEKFNKEYAAFVDEIKAEAALAQAIAKANEAIEEVRVCKERLIVAKQSNEDSASEHSIERSEGMFESDYQPRASNRQRWEQA